MAMIFNTEQGEGYVTGFEPNNDPSHVIGSSM